MGVALSQSGEHDVDARAVFTKFTREKVPEFVQQWERIGSPFCLLEREFVSLLQCAGCSERDSQGIYAFWQVEQKVDILEVLLTSIMGMPAELQRRVDLLFQVLDFEKRRGLNGAEVTILVSKLMSGLHKTCEIHRATAREIEDVVFSMKGTSEIIRPEQVEAGFIPLQRVLGEAIAKRSKLLRILAKKVSPVQDASFLRDNLEVGRLFMNRYRIIAITFPPNTLRIIELSVVDEIPPKSRLLIRLLLRMEYDPSVWERNFMRESALLFKIKHKFAPKVIAFGETDEYLFQISEADIGCTLAHYLKYEMGNYGVPETSVIKMLLSLLEGLDSLRQLKVVHTNICPENILVKNDFSDVKLLSWELATWDTMALYGHTVPILEAFPCGNMNSRNPLYAAPEQMEDLIVMPSPMWDLYALGSVAFECISGHPPFGEPTIASHKISRRSKKRALKEHKALMVYRRWQTAFAMAVPVTMDAESTKGGGKAAAVDAHDTYGDGGFPSLTDEDDSEYAVEEIRRRTQLVVIDGEEVVVQDPAWEAAERRKEHLNFLLTKEVPDIREDVLTCNDLVDIVERMLDKDPDERIRSSALRLDLTILLEALNSLPKSMKACIPHLASVEVAGEDATDAKDSHVLDLRSETRTDFTCRYLAKFANELTVPLLRITGGDIPLDIIRDPYTTTLELRNLSLASHDIMVVAQTLGENRALTSLNVCDNVMAYDSEVSALADPTNFELAGLRGLASNIVHMPLQTLDLSKNCLGMEGGVLIGKTIKSLSETLVTLKLAFCKIMPEGGLSIADALLSLAELKTLDLSHCYIGDTGTIAVAGALEQLPNSKLDSLSLFSNHIDNEGGAALMALLESNFTLLSLSLGDNKIPEVHIRVVQRAIGFNNQYRALKLRNDKFKGFGHNLMAESLKTWGRGNMFIVQRLLYRLQRPRDELEESVATILLADGDLSINVD
eukprot:GEMP01008532.1.p1 GENE.GEMP01008532.1~~GEMP01008532.1.p1  ORF type:complete len:955 (+),score=218.44 GEMP01008532.1:34-2898(+)